MRDDLEAVYQAKRRYRIKIIRRNFQQTADDYHATVTRLSDEATLIWTSRWRWLLRIYTRRRALDRWFARYDKRQGKLADTKEFTR